MKNKSRKGSICYCLIQENINNLHAELGDPSEVITHATTKEMGIQVTGIFRSCEDCALGKTKKGRVCKKAVVCSKVWGERQFFDISSPITPTFGGMKDSTNFSWVFFF